VIGRRRRRAAASFPELTALEQLIARAGELARHRVLTEVDDGDVRRSVHALELGPERDDLPILLVVGGVHGLERIGAEVVIAYLAGQLGLLAWDATTRAALERARVWLLPILNPVGMARGRRANGHGVDLMRNGPTDLSGWATPLVGGQDLSPRLPWYRGVPGAPMEAEAAALCAWVSRAIARAPAAIALDVHSGFGMVDRLWFPWARTRTPLPHLAELRALTQLVEASLPHHGYRIEPQAGAYTIQGDLWDHLYGEHLRTDRPGVFLPLTLEMGSWRWVMPAPVPGPLTPPPPKDEHPGVGCKDLAYQLRITRVQKEAWNMFLVSGGRNIRGGIKDPGGNEMAPDMMSIMTAANLHGFRDHAHWNYFASIIKLPLDANLRAHMAELDRQISEYETMLKQSQGCDPTAPMGITIEEIMRMEDRLEALREHRELGPGDTAPGGQKL